MVKYYEEAKTRSRDTITDELLKYKQVAFG